MEDGHIPGLEIEADLRQLRAQTPRWSGMLNQLGSRGVIPCC